ncbi:alpha/beta fold hydrolase [Actinotalea ferrariae]|uniref:alpha/beta hydrolase family protein n=1 Tax=Actinotalea ferrariae TaxID=1386098 RepID=UPI001C8BF9E6|nr:alpha/beta fold hydrolase [Actinotalea ferrariae]MBX9246513.1 alpha/beta fold hydrolase [Actinotalea ferrariae]
MTPRTSAVAVAGALAAVAAALAGCTTTGGPGTAATTGPEEYRPGLAATTDLPDGDPDAVVLLVPGGSWSTAHPGGLAPLADALVDAGLAVVTVTYGTASSGSSWPEPADDVACAVAYAAAQVPGVPVVPVGHSAGAHLAVLTALAPRTTDGATDDATGEATDDAATRSACEHEPHEADGVVGLAGPYDVARTGGMARNLFGTDAAGAPEAWEAGNPHTWADERPELPALLVHGEDDDVVPTSFTTALADDLVAGGHDVEVALLPGVDHAEVVTPEVVAGLVERWVREALAERP